MVFEHIEKLKEEFTDKFVVVDDRFDELKRFSGLTGTVRTVNMSGRALVEFEGHNNIGWYDIDVDFLSVIDKPLPREEEKPAAKKREKAPSKLEQARDGKVVAAAKPADTARQPAEAGSQAATKAPAKKPGGSLSVADMLAAARAEKSGAARPEAATAAGGSPDEAKASLQQKMEASRQAKSSSQPASAAAKPAAVDASKMTVEQMLAAARGEKSGGAAAADKPPTETETASPLAATETAVEPPAADTDTAASGSRRDITSVADQLAYCRKVDG